MKRVRAQEVALDWPRPWQILRCFETSQDSLRLLRRLAARGEVGSGSKFYLLTQLELDDAIEDARRELEQQVVLLLTASFEAVLRVDLAVRCGQRRRDSHSKALRTRFRKRSPHDIRLEEILDVWISQVGSAGRLGQLKQLVKYRHWLAHGRYWRQKSGLAECDPYEAFERGNQVLGVVPVLAEVDYAPQG